MMHGFALVAVFSLQPWAITEETPRDSGRYVVAFTSNYCAPCLRWKNTELPKLTAAGVTVTLVNVSEKPEWIDLPGWLVQSVPRFWVCDKVTRKQVSGPWKGYTPAETLISAVSGDSAKPPPTK